MNRKPYIIITTVVVSLLLLVGAIFSYFNSNYYYAKKLNMALQEEDIIAVKRIVAKKPTCINTYPSITSRWWHSAMNWRVYYPLNQACGTDNVELVLFLLENGADPNCNDGLTPLSITYSAKYENWYQISQILIEHGATLNYTTEYSGGKSSVLQDIVEARSSHIVLQYGLENKEEVVASFLYALEKCDHNNVNWMRVLQHSVSNDRTEIVRLLLDEGYCNVNDTSVGITALMFAARDSSSEMVQLLLDYGADKTIKTADGKTAYDYAVLSGEEGVLELLQ